MDIKYQIKRAWLNITFFLRPTFTANGCKHKTKREGEIHYFDHTSIMKMPLSKNGNPDYCLDCIARMTIQCAWCRTPITIRSPITLYTPKDSRVPKHAVAYTKDNSKTLVGCTHQSCTLLPDDMSGYWVTPGEIILKEFPTPF